MHVIKISLRTNAHSEIFAYYNGKHEFKDTYETLTAAIYIFAI